MVISTFAGTGVSGSSGDNGAATSAQVAPRHMATDSNGNVFIADSDNHKVRVVNSAGIITTYAGTGAYGFSGDGGAASLAQFHYPYDITIDSNGNKFIADNSYENIRKVDTAGIISTYAGSTAGISGSTGDNGAASSARLSSAYGIVADSNNNIYISDLGNNKIRMVSSSGIITTYAGTGTYGSLGDGGAATSAQLNGPHGLCTDSNGNLFIAEAYGNFVVRKVSSSGIITKFAGIYGAYGYSGDGGPATLAKFRYPTSCAVNNAGIVFIVDQSNYVIRTVAISSGIITTSAGTAGVFGCTGDGGPATSCFFQNLYGVAVDSTNNVYVTDGYKVRMLSNAFACPAGSYVSSISLSTCAACPVGSYSASVSLATSCTPCIANTYSDATGATVCTVCPAGTMNFVLGAAVATSCTVCYILPLCVSGRFLLLLLLLS